MPCEADNIKVMGCSEDEYEQQSPASVLFPGGSDELSGVGSVLAICLCGLGHEGGLAAADARTLEHLQDPVRHADVDLRHRAQHLLRGAGLGTRSFFGQGTDSGKYDHGRGHHVFSWSNNRFCHSVLFVRHAVSLV